LALHIGEELGRLEEAHLVLAAARALARFRIASKSPLVSGLVG
jgi:hypothetical protein